MPEATPLFDAKWRRRGGDLFKNVHLTPPPRIYRTTVEISKYNRPASNSQMPNLFIVASPPLPAPVLIRKNANHPPPLFTSHSTLFFEFPCEVTPGKLCFLPFSAIRGTSVQLHVSLFHFSGKKACSNNYFGAEQSSRPLFVSKSAYSRLFSHLPPNQPKTANQNAVPSAGGRCGRVFGCQHFPSPKFMQEKKGDGNNNQ